MNGCLEIVGLYNRVVLIHIVARFCRHSRVICKLVSLMGCCNSSMTSIQSFVLP